MDDAETSVSRRGFVRTAAGATALAGATGAAGAQQGTDQGTGQGTAGQGNATGQGNETGQGAGQPSQTHTVEMTDDLQFDPDEITVAPGDTVEWVNVGSIGHSVTAYSDEIPAEAEYFASGGFDSQDAAVSSYAGGDPDAGFIPEGGTYQHTFEVLGDYGYYCIPHETAGMVGTVTVSEGGGAPAEGEGGGGAAVPQVPLIAQNVIIGLTAATFALLSLIYLFIKFGGDYSAGEGSG